MAPAMIVLLIMTIAPTIFIFYSAFRNDKILGGAGKFVGLDNFVEALTNPSNQHALLITLGFVAAVVVLEMLLGFALALPLAAQTPGNKVGAALMLLPFAVTPAVAGMVFKQLLNPNYGWVGYYLGVLGFPKGVDLLGDPTSAWIVLIILDLWQWTPFVTLILMAGLQSLPGEPREAAMVDGANPWQMFRHITLPAMVPFIAIAAVLRTIQAFKTFDSFKILTGGGPGESTEIINLGIYRVGLQSFNVGLACALGVIFLIILSLLVPFMLRVIGRRSDPEEI
jgi:multiple sugar transport system permease protein